MAKKTWKKVSSHESDLDWIPKLLNRLGVRAGEVSVVARNDNGCVEALVYTSRRIPNEFD
jgi:hypothetical protein